MFWNLLIGLAAYAIQLALTPKPQNAKPASLDDFDAPVVEEGLEIPVLFGTDYFYGPNLTWYGDLGIEEIKGARRYGFFGPRQVIGHKYSIGMQMVICRAVLDFLFEIWVGDKLAWDVGAEGGAITIDEPDLFGGDDREGGIVGTVDIEAGGPTQDQNDYLVAVLDPDIPSYRGIVTAVMRQVYIGTNTYLKPWAFKAMRIHKKADGTEQWYDAKAAVPDSLIAATATGTQLQAGLAGGDEGNFDTYGDYVAWNVQENVKVWHIPDGAEQTDTLTGSPGYPLAGGTTHLTKYGELVLRTGGDGGGGAHTFLEFRDVGDIGTTLQSIDLRPYAVAVGSTFDLNFGFFMDDIIVGGVNWAYVVISNGATSAYPANIILQRSGGSWIVVSYYGGGSGGLGDSGVNSISMGPTYVYGRRVGDSDVVRYTWAGTWAEDIITLPGYSGGDVQAIHYNPASGEVVVTSTAGDVFVYTEDLGTLLRSDSGFGAFPHNSKRMSSGGTVLVAKTPSTVVTEINFVNVSDLSIDRTILVQTTDYVQKGTAYWWILYNQANGGVVMAAPSLYTVFWPLVAEALDMNPSHIIRECITEEMGYLPADVDDDAFTAAADTLYNECFGLTLKWSREEEIQEFVSMVLAHIDAVAYVSRTTGKFVLKLIRNDYDIDTIPVIDEDDVVSWDEVKKRQPPDAVTSITAKFTDRRQNRGKQASTTYDNDALISELGGVVGATRYYPGISRKDLADRVAQRDQHTLMPGLWSGRIKCKRTVAELYPGDPFRLVSSRRNLEGEVMRVTELDFGDGRDNAITINFVQDVFNLRAKSLIDEGASDWENPSNPPAAVTPRLVWEMPYSELVQMIGPSDASAMLAGDPDAGMVEAAGGRPTSDSIDATIYVDGVKQEIMGFAPAGFLSADIEAFDTTLELDDAVDLSLIEIGGLAAIIGTTPATAEIVRITARASNELTIDRGMLDTVPQAHTAGLAVVVFDDFGMPDFEGRTAGATPDVKLLTRTLSGTLAIGSAPVDEVTLASRAIRPLRPADNQVEGNDGSSGIVDVTANDPFEVTWANRNRLTETTPLAWPDASVALEASATVTIALVHSDGTTIIDDTTYAGLTGTSENIDHADFLGEDEGFVRFTTERDGYGPWQAYQIHVALTSAGLQLFLLEGDMTDGDDKLLLDGDMTDGNDILVLEGT